MTEAGKWTAIQLARAWQINESDCKHGHYIMFAKAGPQSTDNIL